MNTKFGILLIILYTIIYITSCRDDKNGAIYKIIIEQSGEYSAYKKYLILVAAGGLYDEINQKHISTPILEDKYFTNEKICLETCEKIDIFMATLSINRKKTNIQNDFIIKLTVFKDDKIIREETRIYTPQMKYPQTIRMNAAPENQITSLPVTSSIPRITHMTQNRKHIVSTLKKHDGTNTYKTGKQPDSGCFH